MHHPSTEQVKYSNCTVNPSKYQSGDELPLSLSSILDQYFGQDHMPLLTHMIQCRTLVRPGYFIIWVRPTCPGKCDQDDLDDLTLFQP